MMKYEENNGTEEIGLVPPTPGWSLTTGFSEMGDAAPRRSYVVKEYTWKTKRETCKFDMNTYWAPGIHTRY